ncbi:hypothetical protein [Streptomyces avidinii]|uniref:HEAT repeat protein n=1 Tax=Streptomyces avidinii TaxID=1895 RepID=A0ABS4L8F3_STRAV|nr:hypothetical protein [Streptomyces avidinii]MBP2038343.1 hypothetical protein [Streptomyces avidinii]GGZ14690.1 hypothetical protein GCM10010343_47150 [Streptomyces avidinii]
MSAREERAALTPGTSLHDYALFLHGIEPDGRIPAGGYPLPDGSPPVGRRNRLGRTAAEAAVTEAVVPLLADRVSARSAAAVQSRLAELPVPPQHIHRIVLGIVPEDGHTGRARRLARRLIRTGTHPSAVHAGLALLSGLGDTTDTPAVQALGMLREFSSDAVAVLDRIDRRAAAELELRITAGAPGPGTFLDAVTAGDREAVRAALTGDSTATAQGPPRRIAEAARLDELLDEYPQDPDLTLAAGRLLLAMAHTSQYRPQVLDYARARPVYEAVVGGAPRLTPSPDSYALLLALAQDLRSGAGAVLQWPRGRRAELLDALGRLLAEPLWAAVPDEAATAARLRPGKEPGGHRAGWMLRAERRPFTPPGAPATFEIEVVVSDPAVRNVVETRIVLGGRPLVPDLFASGGSNSPESLLDAGRLRAGPEPREVKLAEAYCTEGCCGALYVTIRRDGDTVVWDGWRGVEGKRQPPAYRCDAAAYDAEVQRAENDRSWSWPARDTARLIADGLRERPELLTAWDCRAGGAFTAWDDPETVELLFTYAPGTGPGVPGEGAPWLQFAWRIPDDGTPPTSQARAALERLAAQNPRTWARLCGGSKEYAEALGHDWPPGGP